MQSDYYVNARGEHVMTFAVFQAMKPEAVLRTLHSPVKARKTPRRTPKLSTRERAIQRLIDRGAIG